jgi:hypothetical protein
MTPINLGDVVQDRITAFQGVAVARVTWLFGCTRITVQPQELNKGAPIEPQSFDEPQLLIMDRGWYQREHPTAQPEVTDTNEAQPPIAQPSLKPGGPRPEPTRRRP